MNEYQILDVILNDPVKLPEASNRQVVSEEQYAEMVKEEQGDEERVEVAVSQGVVGLLFQMLEKNPKKRITVEELVKHPLFDKKY